MNIYDCDSAALLVILNQIFWLFWIVAATVTLRSSSELAMNVIANACLFQTQENVVWLGTI